jgi:hypothetical protein
MEKWRNYVSGAFFLSETGIIMLITKSHVGSVLGPLSTCPGPRGPSQSLEDFDP